MVEREGQRAARPARTRLGRLVQERRERAGLSQEELAERVGVTRMAISAIELGRTRIPGPSVINRLVRTLPLTMAEALTAVGFDLDDETRAAGRARAREAELLDQIERLIRLLRRGGHDPADGTGAAAPGRAG